ncbi:sigma-70 family RNA polymerase sigma factor [Luteolibacter pohnpeiensis]|uniref:Sigma-70 family RNA polymerase sigma factor n=1 Tax=Luteolibacter pohnpeiensis TaxID=454153 RepID=A0A934VVG0_9BACT|nr:ECF-type sigma factor [Luteolibacter pohnpeiensis]MBK1882140.1 sigma-70 family RNA polymerase sigma factor [Luteolibacter pohnpeiensis]
MESELELSHFSEDDIRRLYPTLRAMAGEKMAHERLGHTLQPTALVHEAWLRMRESENQTWRNTAHFCAAAAETMRRILIDRGRRRARKKHGGGLKQVPMQQLDLEEPEHKDSIVVIDEALKRLEEVDPQRARLVLLKYFGGMSNREIAHEMKVTERTVERYWAFARTWLYREIQSRL